MESVSSSNDATATSYIYPFQRQRGASFEAVRKHLSSLFLVADVAHLYKRRHISEVHARTQVEGSCSGETSDAVEHMRVLNAQD